MLALCDPDKKRALANLNGDSDATFAPWSSGEVRPLSVAILARILSPPGQRIWTPQDLTGWTIRAAVGNGFVTPVAGNFSLTFGADTTADIQFDATDAQVETALNILASIIAAGGVDVSGSAGYFIITFRSPGGRAQITIDVANLAPVSIGEPGTLVNGDADKEEIQTIRFLQNPGAYAALTTDSGAVTLTPVEVQMGGGGANAKVRLTMAPLPYDGRFAVQVGGIETDLLAWDVTETDFRTALENLSRSVGTLTSGARYKIITYGGTGVELTSGALVSGKKYKLISYVEYLASITSGALVSGKKYKVIAYAAGDDFSNVGGTNTTGEIFTASGTTPTVWTNGSELARIDDFSNIGGTNTAGEIFTTSGTTPASWLNGSTLALVDDFTNLGAAENAEGVVFTASGTTPSSWTAGSVLTSVGAGNVTVIKEEPGVYLLGFKGDLANFDIGDVICSAAALKAIPTKSGKIDMRTAGISLLLGTAKSAPAVFEIEGTPPMGDPQKLYRQDVTVVFGIINPASVSPPPMPGAGSWTAVIPSAADSAGIPGQYTSDGVYAYLCFGDDQWIYWPVNNNFPPP